MWGSNQGYSFGLLISIRIGNLSAIVVLAREMRRVADLVNTKEFRGEGVPGF